MLALFARASAKDIADAGFLALAAMLSVYLGARLVTGDIAAILIETAIAMTLTVAARAAMTRWLPSIGIFIVIHGGYDAIFGPHTGVAEWYPPLCAGFDFLVGISLIIILHKKISASPSA